MAASPNIRSQGFMHVSMIDGAQEESIFVKMNDGDSVQPLLNLFCILLEATGNR